MRIAVLGLGSAGSRHAANAAALGHDVIVYDPAAELVPADVTVAASEAEAIAAADAVVVATPSALHAEQARAALAAGRPVLVEKPLGVDPTDARRVADSAAETGLVAGVAMNLRFHRAVVELKRMTDAGELGPVRLAEATFGYDLRLWRPHVDYRETYSARAELGGGIALDAIHEFDYLLWLLGPVDTVTGETARLSTLEIDVEDTAAAVLRFERGAMATVSLNFLEPVYRRRCILVGDDAVAQWTWGDPELRVRRRDGNERSVEVGTHVEDTYTDVLADFATAVENGTAPRTPLSEGVDAVRVVAALKRSAEEGRRVAVSDV